MAPESGRDLTGTKLNGYIIRRLIGKGGMGEVYEAYEETLDRTVALKVLATHLSEDDAFIARFLREARSAAKLEHPGICPIYSAGESGRIFYIAMQYVDGDSLGGILEDYGSLPTEQALLITRRVADALSFADSKGFIHRDIKPDNIMIDREGRVKVMDFGLARRASIDTSMTQTGTYIGTPEYSSPEQCETLDLDGRSDIYSLGVVLYEMLSGTVPHRAETPYALFTKICTEQPVPIQEMNPRVPDAVASVIGKMLMKDREQRYQSAGELILSIDTALRTLNIDSTAETAAVPVPGLASYTTEKMSDRVEARTVRRRYVKKRSMASVIGIAVAVVVVGLWLAIALSGRGGQEPDKIGAIPVVRPEPVTPVEEPREVNPEPVKKTIIDTPQPTKKMTGPQEGLLVTTLLVCDFVNSNENPEIEWMRIGVADMFVTDLAQCKFMRLVSREELSRLLRRLGLKREGVLTELDRIAGELNAGMILTGSIVKIGRQIRIDIQLLESSSGRILLTEKALEQEEQFLNAIDTLSTTLRGRIAEVVRKQYPDAPEDMFTEAGNMSLEEQVFLADAGVMAREYNRARRDSLLREARRLKGATREKTQKQFGEAQWGKLSESAAEEAPEVPSAEPEARPRTAEEPCDAPGKSENAKKASPTAQDVEGAVKKKADEKPLRRKAKPETDQGLRGPEKGRAGGAGRRGASGPPSDPKGPATAGAPKPSRPQALGKDADEESLGEFGQEAERLDKAVPPKALEKSKENKSLSAARKKFLAMQLYYKALTVLERGEASPEIISRAVKVLKESLQLSPNFRPAMAKIEELRKMLEEDRK